MPTQIFVTLMDAGSGNHAAEESAFRDALLAEFESAEAVASAKSQADTVLQKYGCWPAEEATAAEIAAVDRWHDAENAATVAALIGWARIPERAYFCRLCT